MMAAMIFNSPSQFGPSVLDIPANRHNTDRQRLRGLPAYALPELLITGVFS